MMIFQKFCSGSHPSAAARNIRLRQVENIAYRCRYCFCWRATALMLQRCMPDCGLWKMQNKTSSTVLTVEPLSYASWCHKGLYRTCLWSHSWVYCTCIDFWLLFWFRQHTISVTSRCLLLNFTLFPVHFINSTSTIADWLKHVEQPHQCSITLVEYARQYCTWLFLITHIVEEEAKLCSSIQHTYQTFYCCLCGR